MDSGLLRLNSEPAGTPTSTDDGACAVRSGSPDTNDMIATTRADTNAPQKRPKIKPLATALSVIFASCARLGP